MSYTITRNHPIGLFNTRIFRYANAPSPPLGRQIQIYCLTDKDTIYHFEIFHRVYGRNLIPGTNDSFNESSGINIYIHIDDGSREPQIFNQGIVFDGNLVTYNEKSSASFVRELRQNDRIRVWHPSKPEIQTELLMKISAIR